MRTAVDKIPEVKKVGGGRARQVPAVHTTTPPVAIHTFWNGHAISGGNDTAGKCARLECRSTMNSRQPPAMSRSDGGHAARFMMSSSRAHVPAPMMCRSICALRAHTFQIVSTDSCSDFHAAPRCMPMMCTRMASARSWNEKNGHVPWRVEEGGKNVGMLDTAEIGTVAARPGGGRLFGFVTH
eukprot:25138-Chlamydomonas_euryale.AAC.2